MGKRLEKKGETLRKKNTRLGERGKNSPIYLLCGNSVTQKPTRLDYSLCNPGKLTQEIYAYIYIYIYIQCMEKCVKSLPLQ